MFLPTQVAGPQAYTYSNSQALLSIYKYSRTLLNDQHPEKLVHYHPRETKVAQSPRANGQARVPTPEPTPLSTLLPITSVDILSSQQMNPAMATNTVTEKNLQNSEANLFPTEEGLSVEGRMSYAFSKNASLSCIIHMCHRWKQPTCPSVDEGTNKMWPICTVE